MCVNGNLSNSFWISRSIRQGCPLAPLLYAIATDGLNWLVHDKIQDRRLNGVMLGNGSQVCIKMFVDNINAVVENEEGSISYFWECLQIYCSASGSSINLSKTGFRTCSQGPPPWLIHEDCKPFQDGQEVVRILGIPMGFKVSLKKRSEWLMNKVEEKLKKWQNRMLNMAGRKMVTNHFIIPLVIYFLS